MPMLRTPSRSPTWMPMTLTIASDGQIAQNGDFRGDGRIPTGHEIGQLVLEAQDVDLETVVLVDETDFGADVLVHDAATETGEVGSGKAVLVRTARDVNQMIGRLEHLLHDRQAASHVPEAMG